MMKATLQRAGSIAVMLPAAIGDSLLMMVVVNNLIRNGYRPVVVSWVVAELADWFPGVDVYRESDVQGHFDLVIELRRTERGAALAAHGELCEMVALEPFRKHGHMIDMMVAVARDVFELANVTRENGIAVPPGIRFRANERRVAIHPTGSHIEKIWPRKKFVALARKLIERGFHPTFLVAPEEKPAWLLDRDAAPCLHSFERLGEVAAWIAESGWFIGNDSGLGHLASALGVPTISLFMRRGLARTWRPNWGRGAIVLPRNVFVIGFLKERYWKLALTARSVLRSFERLRLGETT
ncbi:glycosyltransferase family 9 protein [Paraburkholderia phosphatilytica]|uniref:glycosyltransferase family 9 protein n=1 Tax=Paraburkholderia phosphatilytica TaxID=2282883 RepID=UPI000E51A3DB|nr:glycosyltransferase family 9 protein [Paraburkholderia phosphatilytica]